MSAERLSSQVVTRKIGKGWIIAGGILSIILGLSAIIYQEFATVVLEQFIGALCLVTGVVSIALVIFGKERNHRLRMAVTGILRLVAGVLLLANVIAGILALTIMLAVLFIIEGLVCIIISFRLRSLSTKWAWMLLNGIVALVLGGILAWQFPSNASYVLGLLYGIESVFLGVALVMFGIDMTQKLTDISI